MKEPQPSHSGWRRLMKQATFDAYKPRGPLLSINVCFSHLFIIYHGLTPHPLSFRLFSSFIFNSYTSQALAT